jgi:hypothetical protein
VTVIRIARSLLAKIEADLHRPHAFAAERVGYLLARWAADDRACVLLPFDYLPVADDHYIDDPSVGARFSGAAIRAALQATLDHGCACLHVHAHPPVMPYFGGLDLAEQDRLIPSFIATVPSAPHGALLLHGTGGIARIWGPGRGRPPASGRVTTVGFPMTFSER